jgi:type II secretory pathway pseudopilin PulG
MFVESSQGVLAETLVVVAIVGLTLVSTIDLFLQSIKQEKKIDREH